MVKVMEKPLTVTYALQSVAHKLQNGQFAINAKVKGILSRVLQSWTAFFDKKEQGSIGKPQKGYDIGKMINFLAPLPQEQQVFSGPQGGNLAIVLMVGVAVVGLFTCCLGGVCKVAGTGRSYD